MKPAERAAALADPFVFAYLACLLQDAQKNEDEAACGDGRQARDLGCVADVNPELLRDAKADCDGFRAQPGAALALEQALATPGYTLEKAGCDFWLTRVGHGAGYWDRGLGSAGDQLTALCGPGTPYGNLDPEVDDDGNVYLA